MGDERRTGPLESAWAGAVPAATAPPRPPIELTCDEPLARRAARAALVSTVVGPRSVGLGLLALVLGYLVVAPYGTTTWWQVGTAAVGLYLLEVVLIAIRLDRMWRQVLPAGRVVRSWYSEPGVLVVESGHGRTDFRGGSLLSARRRGAVTAVRLRRNRRRGFLPSALVTDDDLTFLVSPRTSGAPATIASPSADLPLVMVVTESTRREMQRAAVGWLWHRPATLCLGGCTLLLLALTVWGAGATSALTALVLGGLLALRTLGTARLVGRAYPPGQLVRVGLSATELRLCSGDDLDDTILLERVRRCVVGRHVVRLEFGRGRPTLILPRALFPAADLARLQGSATR